MSIDKNLSKFVLNDKITEHILINRSSSSFEIPEIFDLSLWRHILIGQRGNQTLCDVPPEYRIIANAYCHAQGRDDCPRIPCILIYVSQEFTEQVRCHHGGKRASQTYYGFTCQKSPALELFSNEKQKPSIIAEAYTSVTDELYGKALYPYHDGKTTKWGLALDGESLAYYPTIATNHRLTFLFDILIGYDRRYFDLIHDVHMNDYIDQITDKSGQRLTIEQVMLNKVLDSPPILWINSNCDTPSNRTNYVLELMRYIPVDSRGRCGNAHWTTSSLNNLDPTMLVKEKMNLSSQYPFTIAIENSLEYDYVTEKLWQPLAAGSIPLYLGAPNIDDWLPCENFSCIINLRDFQTIEQLANHLKTILKDQNKYLSYHRWRQEKVRPSFLRMVDYFQESNQYTLECLICDMIRRQDHGLIRKTLSKYRNPFDHPFPSLI